MCLQVFSRENRDKFEKHPLPPREITGRAGFHASPGAIHRFVIKWFEPDVKLQKTCERGKHCPRSDAIPGDISGFRIFGYIRDVEIMQRFPVQVWKTDERFKIVSHEELFLFNQQSEPEIWQNHEFC
jgi:hypothetical protein